MTMRDDALWPHGTTAEGLEVMASASVSALLGSISIYLGTSVARQIVRRLADDDEFWKQTATMAPLLRERLREADREDGN